MNYNLTPIIQMDSSCKYTMVQCNHEVLYSPNLIAKKNFLPDNAPFFSKILHFYKINNVAFF